MHGCLNAFCLGLHIFIQINGNCCSSAHNWFKIICSEQIYVCKGPWLKISLQYSFLMILYGGNGEGGSNLDLQTILNWIKQIPMCLYKHTLIVDFLVWGGGIEISLMWLLILQIDVLALAFIGNLKISSNIMDQVFKILYVLTLKSHLHQALRQRRHSRAVCWFWHNLPKVLVRINHLVLDNSLLQISQCEAVQYFGFLCWTEASAHTDTARGWRCL